MNKMKKISLTMAFFALGLFVIAASAQARQTGGQGYHKMGSGMMSQLTEQEQKTAMEVMQKHHGPMMELKKQLFSKRAELNAVMAQEKFDAKKARSFGKEIAVIQNKMMDQHMEMVIEMREKGVSYYGTCTMGGPMGSGMGGQRMMMDNGMMDNGMMEPGMMMDGMDKEKMNKNMMKPDNKK
jgi:zinc resistance-associated protein